MQTSCIRHKVAGNSIIRVIIVHRIPLGLWEKPQGLDFTFTIMAHNNFSNWYKMSKSKKGYIKGKNKNVKIDYILFANI